MASSSPHFTSFGDVEGEVGGCMRGFRMEFSFLEKGGAGLKGGRETLGNGRMEREGMDKSDYEHQASHFSSSIQIFFFFQAVLLVKAHTSPPLPKNFFCIHLFYIDMVSGVFFHDEI